MKLSISNIAWDIKNNDKIFQFMKKYVYSGLEIAPTKLVSDNPYEHIDDAKAFVDGLRNDYDFAVSSMQSIWYGRGEKIFGSEEERRTLLDYTRKAVDYASVIGCHNLVFGCPRNRNINSESDYNTAISFFKEIGDYAFSKYTCIGMEANPPIYNTNFINDTESALKLIKDVNSKGFLLNLDVGTMIYNQESADILKGSVNMINHVHVSEPHLKPIEKREIHQQLRAILEKESYTRYISIEMETQEDINVIKNAIQYVKEVFG